MADQATGNHDFMFSDFLSQAITQALDAQKNMVASGKEISDRLAFSEKDGKQVANMVKVAMKTENSIKTLRLPMLTLMPSTPMQIDGAKMNFTLDLDIDNAIKTSTSQKLNLPVKVVKRRLLAREKKLATVRIVKKINTISRANRRTAFLKQQLKQQLADLNSSTTEKGHVGINSSVTLGQSEMPYGISRLLQIAQSQGVRVFDKDTRVWVYVTPEGDCCHKENCRYIKNHSKSKVVADEELLQKKRACKVCKPLD